MKHRVVGGVEIGFCGGVSAGSDNGFGGSPLLVLMLLSGVLSVTGA